MKFQISSQLLFIPIFFIISITSPSSQCLNDHKTQLLQFKTTLKFDSSLSTKLVQWNQTNDCCQWSGVNCDSTGRVTGLDLNSESINGGIDDESSLFSLQSLQMLNLANNNFDSAQLPSAFQNLSRLTYLNLSNTLFAGQIPSAFSRLTRLVTLDLSASSRSGLHSLTIQNPDLKLLVRNLTKLRELYLDGVDISSNRYDWSQIISSFLPNLSVLSLVDCLLSGPLDDSLTKLNHLSVIRLDQNTFSSPFPVSFTKFTKLIVLSLSSCDLSGVFPQMILQIPSLHTIDLSNSRLLEGSLPEFPENGSLQNMVLSYTNFSGKIPNSVSNLKMLSRVEVRVCNFSGKIPNSMSNLTQLVYLDFSANRFTGSIPSFRLSKKLTLINFYNNELTGEIPTSYYEGLNDLEFLALGTNLLTGHVPLSLFSLPSLQFIDLSNNQFSGQINEIPGFSSSLVDTLDLSGNNLQGPIPEFFFELRSLASLSLSSNNFNGNVELSKFSNLQNLNDLDLSHNKFSVNPSVSNSNQFGSLRLASCKLQKLPNLKNQTRLMTLDLSENQINGEIPSWIWESGNGFLRFLNLSHNLFTNIQEPYHFHRHDYIDLNSNKLHGKIPIPPPSAAYVDYSNNNFASSIPNDIGNHLSSVIFFFSVSNNKLVGIIPQSLCNATDSLRVLDLSNNDLHGEIPSCLIKIKTRGVLNLQGNKGLCGAPLNNSCSSKSHFGGKVMESEPLILN